MPRTTALIVGLIRGASWARDIQETDDIEIAAIVDIDRENLSRVGDAMGIPSDRRYDDLQQALRREVDIVILATPAELHLEHSLAALAAGRHVICEKPVAMSLAEVAKLRAAVEATDRRFMVGEQYRFNDGVENLRLAVAKGLIGKPGYIAHEFFRGNAAPWRSSGPVGPVGPPDPHRSIPGMSVHHFDMWWYITGRRPLEVRAEPFNPTWNALGRSFGYSIRATLASDIHVHYLTCRAMSRPQTTWFGNLWIVGDKGALFWDGEGVIPTLTRSLPTHSTPEQHISSGPVSFVNYAIPGIRDGTVRMIHALLEAIREGQRHPCDIEDNLVSFATAIAAMESAETGKPAKVVMA